MFIQAHFLLTLSLICGAGAFWADGNRLFSEDNNLRNVYGSVALPADWRSDPYWGAWLVGEWVGILLTGICVVRATAFSLSPSMHGLNHAPSQIIYYTISPFFTNTGKLFSKSNESYEVCAMICPYGVCSLIVSLTIDAGFWQQVSTVNLQNDSHLCAIIMFLHDEIMILNAMSLRQVSGTL